MGEFQGRNPDWSDQKIEHLGREWDSGWGVCSCSGLPGFGLLTYVWPGPREQEAVGLICIFIYLLVIYVFIFLKSSLLLCWRWISEPGPCGELLPPTSYSLGLWDSPHLPRIPRGFHRNKGLIRGNPEQASMCLGPCLGWVSGPQRPGSLTPLFPTFDLQCRQALF